jgi:hypothetical protein
VTCKSRNRHGGVLTLRAALMQPGTPAQKASAGRREGRAKGGGGDTSWSKEWRVTESSSRLNMSARCG